MEFFVKSGNPAKQRAGCVIAGVYERRKLSTAGKELDDACNGALSQAMRRGDIEGREGETLVLHGLAGLVCDRVLLVGLGRERDFSDKAYIRATEEAVRAVRKTGAVDAVSYLTDLVVRKRDRRWTVLRAAMASGALGYRFVQCKSKPDTDHSKLSRITFNVSSRGDLPEAEEALRHAEALNAGMALTRDLSNLPGNHCTPTDLANTGRELAGNYRSIKTTVLDEKKMEHLGMGALLSVSRGSREPATFTIMEYMQGPKKAKPVVLVGKGLTFDAGGISLKPAQAMDEMKYDMCGGAAVFGAMKAVAELGLPINLVGIVPSSENLPDGMANKPGDIVTSMSGQTIEILNTDAEGRLLLCDALTYVERNYDPDCVIDMATLTGAVIVALGNHATGLFTNQPSLAKAITQAGDYMGDRAWELPMWDDYESALKSPFADMANVGGREAGSVTAAVFLHRFARKLRWAHLDIAGTAWTQKPKGATARPVPLLLQFLTQRANESS